MPKGKNQKFKLYRLAQIMLEQTDEEHYITMPEIKEKLEEYEVTADRKSIYNDLKDLEKLGIEVEGEPVRNRYHYHVVERPFELPELKLLVDAVQSSRFITTKKSRELIRKLEQIAGKNDAGKLQRQVYVAGRVKTENESIYYSIDAIHRAIQENKQISFVYLDWNLKKQLVPRPNGNKCVSPWALIWREENYYLAAYDSEDRVIKHYRVDKMGQAEVTDLPREGVEQFSQIDVTSYTNQTFGMFAGEESVVTMEFPVRLTGVVLDRFGRETDIRPMSEEVFRIRAKVAVSGQFFGWLAGIGQGARIVAPEAVQKRYVQWLSDILREQSQEAE
jgi:predicted DNA-binding transcriptional regulator YafY